jgi:homoserine dehydrogenase
VVEAMGGIGAAYDFTKRSLLKGKHVVTSNKELVAAHGVELLELADKMKVNYLFEASVGGGIPIIKGIDQCLSANEIIEIYGILNGTTNYILTKMVKDGSSFEHILKEAQQKGYAEADPTADVDGHDACRKICILSSLAFGFHVYPESVPTEGIRKVSAKDIEHSAALGRVIKLIGRTVILEDGKVFAYVSPHMVAKSNQLSGVEDVFNGIVVRGNAIGDVMFYGRGAGKLPTASAVVTDVMDTVRNCEQPIGIKWKEADASLMAPASALTMDVYVRFRPENGGEIAPAVSNIFGASLKELSDDCFVISKTNLSVLENAKTTLATEGISIEIIMPLID